MPCTELQGNCRKKHTVFSYQCCIWIYFSASMLSLIFCPNLKKILQFSKELTVNNKLLKYVFCHMLNAFCVLQSPILDIRVGWIISLCRHSTLCQEQNLCLTTLVSRCLLGSQSALPDCGICTTSLCTGEHWPEAVHITAHTPTPRPSCPLHTWKQEGSIGSLN